MPDHFESLQRLARAFTTRDVMVHRTELVRASNGVSAREKLGEYPDFDVIPIERDHQLSHYLERGRSEPTRIEANDILTDGTSILNLVDYLMHRQFFFVLVETKVTGYVHFSDLNSHIVRLPFFILLSGLEEYLSDAIRPNVTRNLLQSTLDAERLEEIEKHMYAQAAKRANLSWSDMLFLPELLKLANHFGVANLTSKDKMAVVNVRNAVAHPTKPLVGKHEHVARLVTARAACTKVLSGNSP